MISMRWYPRGNQSKILEETEQVVHNSGHTTSSFFLVGDLNHNSLDYASSTPVKNFFNLVFENGINRPTRVTLGKCYCNRSHTDKHYYGPRFTKRYNQTRHKWPLSDIYNLEFQNTQPVSKIKNINTNHKGSVGRKLQKYFFFDGLERWIRQDNHKWIIWSIYNIV